MFSYKPLWVLLAKHNMQKQDLRHALGFGPSTVAKMGKGEYVSMEVIDKICTYFRVQPNDVIEHKPDEENAGE
ncbi:helix-turn-helix domain-containing protein [Paenibacillus tyrfis]|uniref:helix-turn-helix domain-containing protein n=1 Tax=Paenibacillus tyrfis TaxID=1501230 RepID=UPI00209E3EE7|nr:helix-turn-helix transcriptional regulator [Paenibacillus tyrfis]MCP1306462.1 helix-turn-helix transcriptional regulator [Paenibacillus tyrfis]